MSTASSGRHKVIAFVADEATRERIVEQDCELARVQLNLVERFAEPALRPAVLGLVAINEGRHLLAAACQGGPGGHLQLFISHAKRDGLPLALAIKNEIAAVPHLSRFYDDALLLLSGDWSGDLERNVARSTVLIVRTDAFDERDACRDEARWADEYACPVLVVDARRALAVEGSALGLGDLPTVRVPDGNVYRALHAALWGGLRGLCVARAFAQLRVAGLLAGRPVRVVPRAPTWRALRRLCRELAAEAGAERAVIIHPEPELTGDSREVLRAYARSLLPGVQLATCRQLLVEARVKG